MKRSLSIAFLSVVLVLAGFWGPASQATSSSFAMDVDRELASGHDRPFTAHFLTSFDPNGIVPGVVCSTGGGTFHIDAGGLALHLGASTLAAESEVDFVSGAQCGLAVITAANGDELEFSFNGGSETDATGMVTFSGDWSITGGSGRFSDAQGGGTYEGSASVVTGLGEWFLGGTIDY